MTTAEKKAKKAYKENLTSSKWELLIKQKQGAEHPLCYFLPFGPCSHSARRPPQIGHVSILQFQ